MYILADPSVHGRPWDIKGPSTSTLADAPVGSIGFAIWIVLSVIAIALVFFLAKTEKSGSTIGCFVVALLSFVLILFMKCS